MDEIQVELQPVTTAVDSHVAQVEAHAAEAHPTGETEHGHGVEEIAHSAEAALEAHAESHEEVHYPRHVSHPPELPHFVQVWWMKEADHKIHEGADPYGTPEQAKNGELSLAQSLHIGRLEKPAPFVEYAPWENNLFAAIAAVALLAIVFLLTAGFRRDRREVLRRPTRGQVLMEMVSDGMDNFCKGILGEKNGRRYMPFVAAMFFFILTMNLMGMVPLMKAPTSSILITASLAIVTFAYYMIVAMFRLGPLKFLHHMAGMPESAVQWVFAPLIFLIEAISWFFAKPLSLALRLFGNILGKDILFGVMLGLGLLMTSGLGALGHYVGVPLTFPFYFLGLLLSAIQALIFALLSAIYILLVLPHDEEHGEHGHHEGELAGSHH